MASGDNIVAIRDERGRYLKGAPGGPGRPVGSRNRLSEDFLRDLQADWEQHGKDILEVMREKHPEIYFQCMVKLALVHPVELYPAGGSNRRQTPEEIMAELEERVGPEGRKMFERFMRRVRRLEKQGKVGGIEIVGVVFEHNALANHGFAALTAVVDAMRCT